MFTLENLVGLTIKTVSFANYGTFGSREENPALYRLTGYVVYYENGYKTISSGGSASSVDYITLTVL
ncbi:hypothetical protein ACI3PL_25925, partial [Lacticaseibacillus paracasei]